MDEKEKAALAAADEAAKAEAEAKAAADAKALEEANAGAAALAAKDEQIKKLTEDRDNYKTVALKRLGKLPGDANFAAGEDTELSVAEQVRIALMDKEIETAQAGKDAEITRMAKENAELKLALNHRPGGSIGADAGATTTVKDNVFTDAQIAELTKRAQERGYDPVRFIANAKRNFASRQ
jgi:hypothetical protein